MTDTIALEELIDRYGLPRVLELLSEIAGAKAEHVDTTWQDGALARVWDRASALAHRASLAAREIFGAKR